ncbi:FxSxx-COOH system tetratricopeptide repeat protein [Pseudonocardia acaciae]|uniref:FxSxx-COOH system tetratricopeptide repeat protein n=1 Tax=Pseudonocardia acaciae TaxID=551276 RepID=UPI000A511A5D|nr:FxSxx-COOH system tetratricopeptide repeat protein [Pseudonocardia acaciae]
MADLSWFELADAVWLASVTQPAGDGPAEPDLPVPPDTQPPPGTDGPDGTPGHARTPEPSPTSRQERSPRQSLVLPVPDLDTGAERQARPFLPGSAGMVRALRPLKRKVLAQNADEVILDEDATAEQAVQAGLWLPVTTPDTTRWLDLTLVVDTSPSMALWRSTVHAFTALCERLGAFRSVQLRRLETDRPAPDSPAQPVLPVLRGGTPDSPIHDPAELLDPTGRRILLVLTDGVGQSWRDDTAVTALLARWGASMPVAVLHLLPQRLWEHRGLALHRARLSVPGPLSPNHRWELELSDSWLTPDPADAAPTGAIPIPVLELEPRWLHWWARLITASHPEPAHATVLLADNRAPTTAPPEPSLAAHGTTHPSADERVQKFLSIASPPAFRLATLLAAVPVSVPVARLVQAQLVPESGADHLAEVFTSGLLQPPDTALGRPWDTTGFDFVDSVRSVLLSGARRAETAHVVRLVADHLDDDGALSHFREALDAPDSTPDPALTPDTAHYVAIERNVMRALSGPYLSRAARIQGTEDRAEDRGDAIQPTERTTSPHRTSFGASARDREAVTMAAVTEPTRPLTPVLDSPTRGGETVREPAKVETSQITPPTPLDGLAPTFSGERHAGDAPPVWGNVPPRNPNFTGRVEELRWLSERLTAGGATAVLPAALHGMGGIGKTQMAVEYIYRHLNDYDIIWWVQATQPAQIRASLTELAQRLRLPGSGEAHTAVPAVREALRVGKHYSKWLLVFDSAESPDAVRPFFPTNGPGEILVTSRNPAWAGVARPLEVAVFSREESKELLKRRGPEIADADADRLAEKLGDLPLAIEQAAAWRAETGMPVHEYLRLFDEKAAEILDTSAPSDYEVSVAAAWNVSFDELSTRNPAAHQLLQVCAFFAPEPISRGLFTGVRGVSISPDLDSALRDPMQLSRTIRDIHRYGLAKIDHRHDTLQLHRLVQLVLSSRMTTQRAEKMRHGAHQLLANFDPSDPVPPKHWPRYQDVLTHAYAANVIACDDAWVRQLVLNLMSFLFYWGDHEEAAELAQKAYDSWSERLGEADSQTLQAAALLGFYLWTLGRYGDAARINKRTVELRRQTSGVNSEETVDAEMSVATDLKGQGDFIAALDLSEQIYQKAKGLFGDDDPMTLTTAQNLAVSLALAGQYKRGRELSDDTYARRLELFGFDNPKTTNTLQTLVLARREAGEYLWARAEQERLAGRLSELFGEDTAITLPAFYSLAVARRKSGDHQGARDLSARVLGHFRVRYGENHPKTMDCALAQSIDLRQAGELDAARELGEETFDRYRRTLGEDHPHTMSARVDLAVIKRLLGDPGSARELDERAVERFRATLGTDHPYAIVAAINLASDMAALGDSEKAFELGTEALARSTRVLGDEHPTTLAALRNLSLDLRAIGRTEEAEKKYVDVMTRYRRLLGDTHPATTAAAAGARADCDIDPLPL